MSTSSNNHQRIVTGRLFRVRAGQRWKLTEQEPATEPEPVSRPARVALMLALAHTLQGAIDKGIYESRAHMARQLGLTRARVTQLLGLLMLAPDIQEALLFMEAIDGSEPLSDRALRPLVQMSSWAEQRQAWQRLRPA